MLQVVGEVAGRHRRRGVKDLPMVTLLRSPDPVRSSLDGELRDLDRGFRDDRKVQVGGRGRLEGVET